MLPRLTPRRSESIEESGSKPWAISLCLPRSGCEKLALDLGCADFDHAPVIHDKFVDIGLDPERSIIGKT